MKTNKEERREDPILDPDEEAAMDRALDKRGDYELWRKQQQAKAKDTVEQNK